MLAAQRREITKESRVSMLFPALHTASSHTALRFGDRALSFHQLAALAGGLAARLDTASRVAVWATPSPETAVGVIAALLAGVPAVPVNPRSGESELGHIVSDSGPSLVLTEPGTELPEPLAGLPRIDVDLTDEEAHASSAWGLPPEPNPEGAALIVYTSGTTGPPKGVVLSRRAIASNLDALEEAWQWSADDVLVHALPLFHVHGLVLGLLGPLRRGGTLRHLGQFTTEGVTAELSSGGTMLFGVPTMYHRLAEACESDPDLVAALASARVLVSGSATLPPHDRERLTAATGRPIIERYGMTETLMNTSVRVDDASTSLPGTVGVPLRDVDIRMADEAGERIPAEDTETVGELQVRGPNLFTEYLNRPDATNEAFDGGWFRTGDMATRDADGSFRIVGRKATDLIKSGGYKIGAGEIENVLLGHSGVAEAAVTGEPDDDLGERVVAWVVPADPGSPPAESELAELVAQQLAPHKRPRQVRYLESLPRNDMGKVMKQALPEHAELPEHG